ASPGKSTCPALKPSVLMQSYPAIGLSHSRQGYPLCKPTSVRLRYVPRHPLGFLQTPLLPVAPLPAGYLPAGWAVGFLSTHRLGRHAGHTKTQPPGEPSGCVICVDLAPPSTLDRAAQKSPDEVLLE